MPRGIPWDTPPPCGTVQAYRLHLQRAEPTDPACKAAKATYERRRVALSVNGYADPTGTVRRLRALAAIGWGTTDLGERLGVTPQAIAQLRYGDRAHVYRETAARITALYDELSMAPRVDHVGRKVSAHARRMGWLPPLAYDDELIDDPTYEPDRSCVEREPRGGKPKLPPTEDLRWLIDEQGMSIDRIADRFGVKRETVIYALRRAERKAA